MDGCARFHEIQRGLPRISPTLLSNRLSELTEAGLVRQTRSPDSRGSEYRLTEAGQALVPIVDHMAVWGQRWARDMRFEDLDPAFLVWSMHTRTDPAALPDGQTVLEFEFDKSPTSCRRVWLVCRDGKVEMCVKHPGHEIDVAVRSELRTFIEAWRGIRDLRTEIARDHIRISGPSRLVERVPDFLLGSMLAVHRRQRSGRESRLAARARE